MRRPGLVTDLFWFRRRFVWRVERAWDRFMVWGEGFWKRHVCDDAPEDERVADLSSQIRAAGPAPNLLQNPGGNLMGWGIRAAAIVPPVEWFWLTDQDHDELGLKITCQSEAVALSRFLQYCEETHINGAHLPHLGAA